MTPKLVVLFFICVTQAFMAADTPKETLPFKLWLDQFQAEALSRGISQGSLDAVIPNIKQQQRAISADRNQPEFNNTYARYLKRVSPWRIKNGQKLLNGKHQQMIEETSAAHAVQARFIVAILGIETNYGRIELTHSAFDVLATMAFDGRRSDFFRRELFAAFQIIEQGLAPPDQLKSSWAGALGYPQFNPSNYLGLAVDEDGNGVRDIWRMGPDVIGSIANYLNASDWHDDQTWGREVRLPSEGEQNLPASQADGLQPDAACAKYKSMGVWRSLPEWQALGVRTKWRANLPKRPLAAALILGDKGDNKAYLVYRNFCSIMSYNPSFRYALGIGLLSDAIAR